MTMVNQKKSSLKQVYKYQQQDPTATSTLGKTNKNLIRVHLQQQKQQQYQIINQYNLKRNHKLKIN